MADYWRNRLQPASFKGARFWVESTNASGGRRVNLKRIAGGGRASIIATDLNEEPEEVDITAFVFGPQYDKLRDALEDKLREGGVGPLVLPTRGLKQARITRGPSTSEQRSEGGYCMVRFSAYLEPEEATGLRAEPDTSAQLSAASQKVARAAVADATKNVSNKGFTQRQLERATSLVSTATRSVQRVNRMTGAIVAPAQNLTRDLDAFNQSAVTLMSTPALFATTLLDLVFTAYSIPQTAVGGVERLASVSNLLATTAFGRGRAARLIDRIAGSFRAFGEPFHKPTGSQQQRAEDVRSATARLVRAASVSAASAAYAEAAFDSATFAVAAGERLVGDIDGLQKLGPPDDLFAALDDLRAALARHVYETASKLPETVLAELRTPLPALLVAYVLYGDANEEADLVARNRIAEPLFVQGRIEVLRP